jgi:hypothetical protein
VILVTLDCDREERVLVGAANDRGRAILGLQEREEVTQIAL